MTGFAYTVTHSESLHKYQMNPGTSVQHCTPDDTAPTSGKDKRFNIITIQAIIIHTEDDSQFCANIVYNYDDLYHFDFTRGNDRQYQ